MNEHQPTLKIISDYIGGEAIGLEALVALVVIAGIVCRTTVALASLKKRR